MLHSSPHRILLPPLALLLLCASAGCGLLPSSYRHKHKEEVWSRPLFGVEDVVFHGHQQTGWRQWNDAMWRAETPYRSEFDVPEEVLRQSVPDTPYLGEETTRFEYSSPPVPKLP